MRANSIVSRLALASLAVVMLAGCGAGGSGEVSFEHELSVAYSEWPPDMMVYLAKEKGFFADEGLDATLVKVEGVSDAADIREAGEQELHVWAYPILDFLTEYATGVETEAQAIMVEDYSEGADAIISYNLTDIADLSGSSVGVEKGTVGEFFLSLALDDAGIDPASVQLVDVLYDDVPAAVAAGEVDAGVTYEPDVTAARSDGANVLLDSSQTRRAIVDVFVANRNDLAERPEAYRDYVRGIFAAYEYYEKNSEEAAEILAPEMGITPEEVIEAFETLSLPNLEENIVALDRLSGPDSLYNLARTAETYLEDQGIVTEQLDLDDLINTEIIEGL